MYKKSDVLGVFDSGVGGLTVVQSLMKHLPNETIYYLADTLNLPYGNKKKSEIERYSIQNMDFLLKYPLKALIIACSTASALAYETLKLRFNVPIFDVITPTVEEAAKTTQNRKIAVLATESTIHSNVYEKLLKSRIAGAQVFSIACPLLVPIVEDDLLEHQIASKVIQQYLAPLKNSGIDTLILGCTHYPLLKNLIQKELPTSVTIIDSAGCCARTIGEFLKKNKLDAKQGSKPSCHFFVSDNPENFEKKGSRFLNQKISSTKKIDP